jgi:hypothetical protein
VSYPYKEERLGLDPQYREKLLHQCRFLQLLTDAQCDHIEAALKDRNARVLCERDEDHKLRFVVIYEVEL